MIERFRPLLAPQEDPISFPDFFRKLNYPLLGSAKLDGIRALPRDNVVYSRTMKPIPSYQVQDEFGWVQWGDGELIEGNATDPDVYNRTQSHVMSREKFGELTFHVFDFAAPQGLTLPYYRRLEKAQKHFEGHPNVTIVDHFEINNETELLEAEEGILSLGYEGMMLRNPLGHYKMGRGTFKEGIIYKLKRVEMLELRVIGFVEKMHNTNLLETNELGLAKRSHKKEGMVNAGTLGKFIVDYNGEPQNVAPGTFKHSELQEIWDNRDNYLEKFLCVKHFPIGVKDKLRQPRAHGWRDEIDMVKG